MLKIIPVAAIAIIVGAAVAQAQSTQTTPAEPAANAAVSTAAAPTAGANSFTEGQARSRLEKNGYLSITGLIKDAEGIWRGKAMKDGKAMDVALDFKGVIVAN